MRRARMEELDNPPPLFERKIMTGPELWPARLILALGESMGGVTGLTVAPVVWPRAAGAAAKAANADIMRIFFIPHLLS